MLLVYYCVLQHIAVCCSMTPGVVAWSSHTLESSFFLSFFLSFFSLGRKHDFFTLDLT